MPRPNRSYGRPGTRVIPKDWSPSHAKVIAKTWTATCRIFPPRAAGGTLTVGADLTVSGGTPATAIYEGACRLQVLNAQESSKILADQEQTVVGYLVVIDREANIPHRAVIEILTADDPTFPTRRLVVRKVDRGSQIWERDLYAVDDLTAPE